MSTWRPLAGKAKEDPFRSDARPSLHPITINALAEVIRRRSISDPKLVSTNSALERAMVASAVAADSLHKRQVASKEDGMDLSVTEQQTIAGRVVGVTLRCDDLEKKLEERCRDAAWIAKYNEWHAFGCTTTDAELATDPLLRIHRAESLLAIFLHEVEIPELVAKNVTVPDASVIDFLDADRREVLLV